MSPELQADFVAQWPELSRRLNALFARKNVSQPTRDDLIQETALRLIKIWDSVDMTRSPWPLTATIGLNLLRDRAKSLASTEVLADLPDAPAMLDVADAGIARVELERVRKAMTELTAAQRTILLDEVGEASAVGGSAASQKMLRMRARRKLRAILEHVSGLVALRTSRVTDWLGAAFASRDAMVQGAAACVACALIGTAAVAAGVPTRAEAQPLAGGRGAAAVLAEAGRIDRLALTHLLRTGRSTDSRLTPSSVARRVKHSKGHTARLRSSASSGQSGLPLPTGPGDTPVPMPPAPNVPAQKPPAPPAPPKPEGLPPLPLPAGPDGMALPLPVVKIRVL
ncbi:MAG: hypothetical protein QOG54_2694 [Actinomycetota bacterium]|jgi:DNA-directed RNA polymerase specialized sigma24 family protein|nr:hypothetical protein [Actinomycetota bacterium]